MIQKMILRRLYLSVIAVLIKPVFMIPLVFSRFWRLIFVLAVISVIPVIRIPVHDGHFYVIDNGTCNFRLVYLDHFQEPVQLVTGSQPEPYDDQDRVEVVHKVNGIRDI